MLYSGMQMEAIEDKCGATGRAAHYPGFLPFSRRAVLVFGLVRHLALLYGEFSTSATNCTFLSRSQSPLTVERHAAGIPHAGDTARGSGEQPVWRVQSGTSLCGPICPGPGIDLCQGLCDASERSRGVTRARRGPRLTGCQSDGRGSVRLSVRLAASVADRIGAMSRQRKVSRQL